MESAALLGVETAAALIVLGYLLGSIPTGILLARRAGVDIRATGSGNIGATNVARTAGSQLGILTLLGDLLKGLVAVLLARALSADPPILGAVAFVAVVGHIFPVFLRFQGGKGVATGVGVLLGLAPLSAIVCMIIFAAIFGVFRIVSLASIVATVSAPIALWVSGQSESIVLAAIGIAVLIAYRHRDNISRLLSGSEPRFRSR